MNAHNKHIAVGLFCKINATHRLKKTVTLGRLQFFLRFFNTVFFYEKKMHFSAENPPIFRILIYPVIHA